ncbi:hypothetical protein D1872_310610 [compost metagenome]
MRDMATIKATGPRTNASAGIAAINGMVTENMAVVWPEGKEWSVSGFRKVFVPGRVR